MEGCSVFLCRDVRSEDDTRQKQTACCKCLISILNGVIVPVSFN